MRLRRKTQSPVGVEVTPSGARLIQFEWANGRGRVCAHAEVPHPHREDGDEKFGSDLAAAVRKSLKSGGFKGRRAVAALPSFDSILRHVKVEATRGQELHDALLFELEDAFPGDTPLVQHLEVGEVLERGERRHELILIAAGLERVKEYLSFLEDAGLEPVAIDAQGCALIRCFTQKNRRDSDADTHTGIIHIGETQTLMTISGQDRVLFMKQLPMGTEHLVDEVSKRLDLSLDDLLQLEDDGGEQEHLVSQIVAATRLQLDSLVLELSSCLRYHAASRRSTSAPSLIVCGPGSRIPGISDALSLALNARLNSPDPFTASMTGIEDGGELSREFSSWSVPVGLALREVE